MEHLDSYLEMESADSDVVVCAHQLRKAIREIGFISGKVSSDKILDVVFSDFCIGK
jgi:tRNA modification GTPase